MKPREVGKYTHSGVIDAQPLKDHLVRLSTKAKDRLGAQREKPGFAGVEHELATAMPDHGEAAGIPEKVYQSFKDRTAIINEIRALLPFVEELRSALLDSLVHYEDGREGDISRMATYIEAAAEAEGLPGLLAVFQKTLAYRSQYAAKAVAARRKNQEKARIEEPKPEDASASVAAPVTASAPVTAPAPVTASAPVTGPKERPSRAVDRVERAGHFIGEEPDLRFDGPRLGARGAADRRRDLVLVGDPEPLRAFGQPDFRDGRRRRKPHRFAPVELGATQGQRGTAVNTVLRRALARAPARGLHVNRWILDEVGLGLGFGR
jgi:hypothetical protein